MSNWFEGNWRSFRIFCIFDRFFVTEKRVVSYPWVVVCVSCCRWCLRVSRKNFGIHRQPEPQPTIQGYYTRVLTFRNWRNRGNLRGSRNLGMLSSDWIRGHIWRLKKSKINPRLKGATILKLSILCWSRPKGNIRLDIVWLPILCRSWALRIPIFRLFTCCNVVLCY